MGIKGNKKWRNRCPTLPFPFANIYRWGDEMKSAKHKRKYYFFAWSGMLNLEFSGNTANCSVSVIAVEQEIKVSMSLW